MLLLVFSALLLQPGSAYPVHTATFAPPTIVGSFAPLVVLLVQLRLFSFLHLSHVSLGCKHHEVLHFLLQLLRDHNDLKVKHCARSLV